MATADINATEIIAREMVRRARDRLDFARLNAPGAVTLSEQCVESVVAAEAAVQALVTAARRALAEANDISSGTYQDADSGTTHWGCCHREVRFWPREVRVHEKDCWTHALAQALAPFKD